jgi:hypothetical protein
VTHQYAAVKIVPKPRPQAASPTSKADKVRLAFASLYSLRDVVRDGSGADAYCVQQMLLGIEREIVIMKLIEHPNVLRLMDVWETGNDL